MNEFDPIGYFGDVGAFLSEEDPEMLQKLIEEWSAAGLDGPLATLEGLDRMKSFAHYMVRYAADPRSSTSVNPITGEVLTNPDTGRPFTFEDLGVDRKEAVGSTTGVAGREKIIARTMVALYRRLHPED